MISSSQNATNLTEILLHRVNQPRIMLVEITKMNYHHFAELLRRLFKQIKKAWLLKNYPYIDIYV